MADNYVREEAPVSSDYGEDSIDLLEGSERIRKRPASMLGNNDIRGAQHGVIEICGNATDEATAGFGDRLDFKVYKDGSISVRDHGRGVPLGWNESKKSYNWHIIYNELYGGGKYETHQSKLQAIDEADAWDEFDSRSLNYLYSVGLNGLGAASTQYTSEFFDVVSIRTGDDGKNYRYEMHFMEGCPIIDGRPVNVQKEGYDLSNFVLETVETDEETGTFIHWKPDPTVFTDVNITPEWLFTYCEDVAYVAGLTLSFENEVTGEYKVIDAGDLSDLMNVRYGDDISEERIIVVGNGHGKTTVEGSPFIWVSEFEIILAPIVNENIEDNLYSCYHNTVKMKSGVQYQAISEAIYDLAYETARSQGVKITYDDCRYLYAVILSSYSNYASFRNQTKDEITDVFIFSMLRDAIYNKLKIEYSKGNKAVTDVIKRIIDNANMRVQLKEASKQIREITKMRNKPRELPEKFKTCREFTDKDYHRTELWITEGDSAGGAVLNARDSDFQAVLPIRGKSLNVFKASIAKILKNKEIRDIFTLLGTGIDINIKGEKLFDIDDLRFDKIVIATDGDVDGFQIRVLVFAILYRLAPKLLTEGHVFIAETPRFGITLSDGNKVYALTDTERDQLLQEYEGRVTHVARYKGLGEVDADILSETTVAVETRNLIPVTVDFNNDLECDLIDALFGADKKGQRKEILTTVLGSGLADDILENARLMATIDADEDIDDGVEYEVWD